MKTGHAVLLLHGLGGSPIEMRHLQKSLERAGYHVEVPLLPGHCTNYKDLCKYTWENYADLAYTKFEELYEKYETVSVAGLCMGAVLCLAIGIRYGDKVRAICPISTTLNFDGWGLPTLTPLMYIARCIPFYYLYNVDEGEPYGVKDEKIRACIKKAMSGDSHVHYSKTPIRAVMQMHKLNKYVKKNMHKIVAPVCAIHPAEDEVSSLRSVEDIRAGVMSRTFKSLILTDSYHLATIDRERFLVTSTVVSFIAEAA